MYRPSQLVEDQDNWLEEVYSDFDKLRAVWTGEALDIVCQQVQETADIRQKPVAIKSHVFTGPDRTSGGVNQLRVDVHSFPNSTKTFTPHTFEGLRKTVYITTNGSVWDCVQENEELSRNIPLDSRPENMVVVYHLPIEEGEERTCYMHVTDEWNEGTAEFLALQSIEDAARPDISSHQNLTRRQARDVDEGRVRVQTQDRVMWNTILRSPGKIVLLLTAAAGSFTQGNAARCEVTPNLTDDLTTDGFDAIIADLNSVEDPKGVMQLLDAEADKGKLCVALGAHESEAWNQCSMESRSGVGDLRIASNSPQALQTACEWADQPAIGTTPKSIDDVDSADLGEALIDLAVEHSLDRSMNVAFAGTTEDAEEQPFLDTVEGPEDLRPDMDDADAVDLEKEMLEELPLPGNPKSERDRKRTWLQLPRRVRIAIRRLHRNFRHMPKPALVAMLKAAKAPAIFIEAARKHRCDTCEQQKPRQPTHKVSAPKPYTFNHEVGVDVFEVKDSQGHYYDVLNCVCMGTTFQQAFIVRDGNTNGVPKSSDCLKAFYNGWVRPYGLPMGMVMDRGLHNRGVFSTTLQQKGVTFRQAALEAPEQIGRVERRNAMLKHMMQKVIKDTEAIGRDAIDMILTESINAINELARHDGFAPAQWVLSKLPRQPATLGDEREASDIGTMQAHVDGPTAFALQSEYRQKARERFIEWDCSQRIQRGILRNAQPVGGPYEVGDIVSYCRRPRQGESGNQWSIASRVIGFEGDNNVWVLCDNLPVLVARDRLRPCNSAELLAFQYMQQQKTDEGPERATRYRDKYVDESDRVQKKAKTDSDQQLSRATTFTGGGSSSSTAPPPTDVATSTSKRKGVVEEERTDEEGDPREDPTSLAQIWKRTKTTGKGVQLLEKMAYYFQTDEDTREESDRVGFLQVRLVQGKERQRTKKQVKKDGDKKPTFQRLHP